LATRSKRVLLTGARGFTGVHLRRELETAGYTVIGLVHESAAGDHEFFADLRDASATRDAIRATSPDHVIHLAAISFVGHANVDELYTTNVLGTVHLLEALASADHRPERVVLASSANVYGDVRTALVGEDSPPQPANHYAATKVAMEAAAQVYRSTLPITITRPFNYTGPGQAGHFVVPKIVEHFARRASRIELGNLDVVRDFLDVRVVATLYRQLLECDAAVSQVINLCSGRGIDLGGIIAKLEEITGHSLVVEVNPAFVRGNELKRLVGSNARLLGLVGNLPDLPFERTLRDMVTSAAANPHHELHRGQ